MLFAVLLAIPVLAGSAAYAIGEILNGRVSLEKRRDQTAKVLDFGYCAGIGL